MILPRPGLHDHITAIPPDHLDLRMIPQRLSALPNTPLLPRRDIDPGRRIHGNRDVEGNTAGAAAPAYAADAKPNKTVEMPAAWLTKPGTKFCLSRGLIARERRGNLPGTVCQTRDEWSAVGVDIVARK